MRIRYFDFRALRRMRVRPQIAHKPSRSLLIYISIIKVYIEYINCSSLKVFFTKYKMFYKMSTKMFLDKT